mmetsp:Transcript_25394/g.65311  ORF Transcript_25394/g.65311 Transcript_25394/m.65311 type:complete len:273 (-) Transcript_25394:1034-1852(-)
MRQNFCREPRIQTHLLTSSHQENFLQSWLPTINILKLKLTLLDFLRLAPRASGAPTGSNGLSQDTPKRMGSAVRALESSSDGVAPLFASCCRTVTRPSKTGGLSNQLGGIHFAEVLGVDAISCRILPLHLSLFRDQINTVGQQSQIVVQNPLDCFGGQLILRLLGAWQLDIRDTLLVVWVPSADLGEHAITFVPHLQYHDHNQPLHFAQPILQSQTLPCIDLLLQLVETFGNHEQRCTAAPGQLGKRSTTDKELTIMIHAAQDLRAIRRVAR